MEVVPALLKAKGIFTELVKEHRLDGETVRITVSALKPEEAIGKTTRPDFALMGGKEVMVEANFRGSFGQAFTTRPRDFSGRLDEVLKLSLDSPDNRALLIATMNAVCSYLGIIGKVRHCHGQEPEQCGQKIASELLGRYGRIRIGMIGYQPAILENLTKTFGAENIRCSDLDPRNIGTNRFGVTIWDGSKENNKLIKWAELLLVTGSTHVNNTFDELYREASSQGKDLIMFGVTGAAIAALLGLEIICPLAR